MRDSRYIACEAEVMSLSRLGSEQMAALLARFLSDRVIPHHSTTHSTPAQQQMREQSMRHTLDAGHAGALHC